MSTPKPVVAKPSQKPKPVRKPTKAQKVKATTPQPEEVQELELVAVTEKAEEDFTEAPITTKPNPLNLLHTSALLQLATKPEEQNEVAVPSSVLMAADNDQEPTMQKVTLITVDKTRPRPTMLVSNAQVTSSPIQDPGIQSSISHITGQLADVPLVTTIVSNANKKPQAKPESSASVSEESLEDDEEEDEDAEGVEVVENFEDDDEKSENDSLDDNASDLDSDSLSDESDLEQDDDDEDKDEEDDEEDEEEVTTEKIKKKKKKTTKNDEEDDDEDDDDLLGAFGLTDTKNKKTKKVKADKVNNSGLKKEEDDDFLGFGSLGFRRIGGRASGRQNKMLRIR